MEYLSEDSAQHNLGGSVPDCLSWLFDDHKKIKNNGGTSLYTVVIIFSRYNHRSGIRECNGQSSLFSLISQGLL